MFRSEDMCLKKVMFAKESLWETLNLLARSEKVMIVNAKEASSSIPQTVYMQSRLKHFEEIFNMIDFAEQKMKEFGFVLPPLTSPTRLYYEELDRYWLQAQFDASKINEEIEEKFKANIASLNGHLEHYKHLVQMRTEMAEKVIALKEIDHGGRAEELMSSQGSLKRLHWVVGLIPTVHLFSLQKLIFRISKENVIMKSANLDKVNDPRLRSDDITQKALVWICVPKGEKEILAQKILAVLGKFGMVSLDVTQSLTELHQNLKENSQVMDHTLYEIKMIMIKFKKTGSLSSVSRLQEYRLVFKREESFTRQLDNLIEKDGFYELKIWVPKSYSKSLVQSIDKLGSDQFHFTKPKILDEDHLLEGKFSPPTRFSMPDIGMPFQLIVDTYGVPRYKEANPAIFSIISFPFMFGLMFGDVGHGGLLLAAGIYLTFFNTDKQSSFHPFRHMVLLMGIFAFYCGLIYNEFFSVPLVLSKTCWWELSGIKEMFRRPNCVYPFGLDYIWFQSSNETLFLNSFKMKFAIIIGVLQMVLGICLKVSNAVYFRKKLDLLFEAIPQLVFMLVTFGYMVFCIVVKWLKDWTNKDPPSIISLFINFYKVTNPLFFTAQSQQALQEIFIILAIASVILMLLPKPIVSHFRRNIPIYKRMSRLDQTGPEQLVDEEEHLNEQYQKGVEEEGLGELMVHQMIETVEFVLGSISNTASYLRLWALSLAHAQLSKVFLTMIFSNSLKDNQSSLFVVVICIVGYLFWAFVTLGIIMGMDSLECFLHSLRLHWVEFQNKFFKGDGKLFEPFQYS